MKDSFLLFKSHYAMIKELSDEERGKLLLALYDWQVSGELPVIENVLVKVVFISMQQAVEAANKKYDEVCERRREAGKLGGRPPKANGFEEKAKKANDFFEKQNKANDSIKNRLDIDIDIKEKVISKDITQKKVASDISSCPYQAIVEKYLATCVSFPRVISLSLKRKQAIKARWVEYDKDIEVFTRLFEAAEASDFLKGKNNRNWSANFDWLVTANNMAKVLEGNYANKQGGLSGGSNGVNAGIKGPSEFSYLDTFVE